MADDADTLRWLAQVNCITPHVWTSRADRLDRPDRMIFDFDPPDEGAEFDHIREGALAMGELLRELGREPYAMTSGSRGIHVVAPLRRTAVHDVVRERAREIAEELATRHPERLTTEWRKAKREGRILIDTARNTYAQTTSRRTRCARGRARRSPRRCAGRSSRTRAARGRLHAHHAARAARARGRPVGGARAGVESRQRAIATASCAAIPCRIWALEVGVLSIAREVEPAPPSADHAWSELREIVARGGDMAGRGGGVVGRHQSGLETLARAGPAGRHR